jgi:biofilm protein TabA
MRLIATVNTITSHVKRVMIYADNNGVSLFGYKSTEDSGADWDQWYSTIADAKAVCAEEYRVTESEWTQIAEPLPDCQHDWIAPVRVKGRAEGAPQWGCLEELVNGIWKPRPASDR